MLEDGWLFRRAADGERHDSPPGEDRARPDDAVRLQRLERLKDVDIELAGREPTGTGLLAGATELRLHELLCPHDLRALVERDRVRQIGDLDYDDEEVAVVDLATTSLSNVLVVTISVEPEVAPRRRRRATSTGSEPRPRRSPETVVLPAEPGARRRAAGSSNAADRDRGAPVSVLRVLLPTAMVADPAGRARVGRRGTFATRRGATAMAPTTGMCRTDPRSGRVVLHSAHSACRSRCSRRRPRYVVRAPAPVFPHDMTIDVF